MEYITISQVKKISKEIIESKDVSNFDPQSVVYIESAGRLIGRTISDYANLPLYSIQTVRSGSAIKEKIKIIFNFLPWQISHLLRKIELSTSLHKFSQREINVEGKLPEDKKTRILLVDDAIDSGNSMKSVYEFLIKLGYENIYTAVITTTSSNPIFKADYSHFNKLLTFPWSIGSKEYYKYQKLYHSLNEK